MEEEENVLIDILDRVNDSDKRVLSTGKIIDNVFKQIISCSVFEYPVHLFILDLSDPLWKNHFTAEEMNWIFEHRARYNLFKNVVNNFSSRQNPFVTNVNAV